MFVVGRKCVSAWAIVLFFHILNTSAFPETPGLFRKASLDLGCFCTDDAPDFVAIEVKYSKAPAGIASAGRPRCDPVLGVRCGTDSLTFALLLKVTSGLPAGGAIGEKACGSNATGESLDSHHERVRSMATRPSPAKKAPA